MLHKCNGFAEVVEKRFVVKQMCTYFVKFESQFHLIGNDYLRFLTDLRSDRVKLREGDEAHQEADVRIQRLKGFVPAI
jgi:hypothetical protein